MMFVHQISLAFLFQLYFHGEIQFFLSVNFFCQIFPFFMLILSSEKKYVLVSNIIFSVKKSFKTEKIIGKSFFQPSKKDEPQWDIKIEINMNI